MANANTSKPQRHTRTVQETIHRPWTNPNRPSTAPPPLSNRARIRDIQRRLRLEASRAQHKHAEQHVHEERRKKELRLPADKQRDYERELAELVREDAIREAEKRRNGVMKRYKKVKFVEARKAERRWKAAQRHVTEAGSQGDKKKAQQALHVAEVDRNYVKYCPLGWTYVSLFAADDKDDAAADERRGKGDPDMWKRVEQAMTSKGALERLKNELVITVSVQGEVKSGSATAGEDEGSDEDFFE